MILEIKQKHIEEKHTLVERLMMGLEDLSERNRINEFFMKEGFRKISESYNKET